MQKAKTLDVIFESKNVFENDNFVGGLIFYRKDQMLFISINKMHHNLKTCSEKQIVQTTGNSYSLVLGSDWCWQKNQERTLAVVL